MAATVFIGDELSAAGFRLAGIETVVSAPDAAASELDAARRRASLVLITSDLARHIPPAMLEAAVLDETPALAIVPDVLGRAAAPDLARRLRSALGIET